MALESTDNNVDGETALGDAKEIDKIKMLLYTCYCTDIPVCDGGVASSLVTFTSPFV